MAIEQLVYFFSAKMSIDFGRIAETRIRLSKNMRFGNAFRQSVETGVPYSTFWQVYIFS